MLNNLSHDGEGFNEKKALEAVFANFYEKFRSMAFYHVKNWQDADDIASEAIQRLWNKRRHILPDEDKVKGFLFKTTKNLCIDYARKQNRSRVHYPGELKPDLMKETMGTHFTRNEVVTTLYPWIESLSGRDMEVLKMSYLDGMTDTDIAEALQIEVQSVYNCKSRALKTLKEDVPPEIQELWFNWSYLLILAMLFKN